MHSLLRKSKHAYYQQSISDCGNDSKKMFKFANALLNRKQTSPLPANACSKSLASLFSQFFVSKIDSIRRHLCTDVAPLPPLSCIGLATLADTTSEEIESLIRNNPVKSCELDPIPTKLLKECAAIISPYIADVVNLSLQSGKVPKALKIGYIHPLLKKPSLDPECLQNYRPVSNLPYLSKLLERVAFSRLYDYLQENDLLDNHQSAYRANHSVETLLVNLSNNILTEMDVGRITAVVLLDLSAAFDTVDHRILVNVLSSIGIRDHALEWFMSYLDERQQLVCVNHERSDPVKLSCGVPQGSVGGPLLFSLYITRLKQVLQQHDVKYHCYADDIQIYASFLPNQNDASRTVKLLEACVKDVQTLMNSNSLKLNDSKTELILLGSKSNLAKIQSFNISISDSVISPSSQCRNLGVMLNSSMSLSTHVSSICKSVRYQLRNLGFIRKYLSRSTTEKLVHALISTRLDFCNSILYLLPNTQLSRLQKLQNTAARIVTSFFS